MSDFLQVLPSGFITTLSPGNPERLIRMALISRTYAIIFLQLFYLKHTDQLVWFRYDYDPFVRT